MHVYDCIFGKEYQNKLYFLCLHVSEHFSAVISLLVPLLHTDEQYNNIDIYLLRTSVTTKQSTHINEYLVCPQVLMLKQENLVVYRAKLMQCICTG